MFQGFPEETIRFFLDLRFHNEVPWFHAHRDEYEAYVREPFRAFIEAMSPTVLSIAEDIETRPNKCLARINRDIRFTRDKSPYRDCCWISFHHTGEEKGKLPGFFFEVRDSGGFCGMGFYKGNKPLMDCVRKLILEKPGMMLDLVQPLMEEYHFYPELSARIAIPEQVPAALRTLYAAKTFYFEKIIDDFNLIRSPALAQELRQSFERFKPLYRAIIDLYMQQA